jgi:hypothetical protein
MYGCLIGYVGTEMRNHEATQGLMISDGLVKRDSYSHSGLPLPSYTASPEKFQLFFWAKMVQVDHKVAKNFNQRFKDNQ